MDSTQESCSTLDLVPDESRYDFGDESDGSDMEAEEASAEAIVEPPATPALQQQPDLLTNSINELAQQTHCQIFKLFIENANNIKDLEAKVSDCIAEMSDRDFPRELLKAILFAMGYTDEWSIEHNPLKESIFKVSDMLKAAGGKAMPFQLPISATETYEKPFRVFIFSCVPKDGVTRYHEQLKKICKYLTTSVAASAKYTGILISSEILRKILDTLERERERSLSQGSESLDSDAEGRMTRLCEMVSDFVELLYKASWGFNVESRIASFKEICKLMVKYPAAMVRKVTIHCVASHLTSTVKEELQEALKTFAWLVCDLDFLDNHCSTQIQQFIKENGRFFILNLKNEGENFTNSYKILERSYTQGWLDEEAVQLLEFVMYQNLFSASNEICKATVAFYANMPGSQSILFTLSDLFSRNNENLQAGSIAKPIAALINDIEPNHLQQAFNALANDNDMTEMRAWYLLEVVRHVGELSKKEDKSNLMEEFNKLLARHHHCLTCRFSESLVVLQALKDCSKLLSKHRKATLTQEMNHLGRNIEKLSLAEATESPNKKRKPADVAETKSRIMQLKEDLPSISDNEEFEEAIEALDQAFICLHKSTERTGSLALECGGIVDILTKYSDVENKESYEQLILDALSLEIFAYHKLFDAFGNDKEWKRQFGSPRSPERIREKISNFIEGVTTCAQNLLQKKTSLDVDIAALHHLFEVLVRSKVKVNEELVVENLQRLILNHFEENPTSRDRKRVSALNEICHEHCLFYKKISAHLFLAVGDARFENTAVFNTLCNTFLPLFTEAIRASANAEQAEKIQVFMLPINILHGLASTAIEDAGRRGIGPLVARMQRSVVSLMKKLGTEIRPFKVYLVMKQKELWTNADSGSVIADILLAAFGAPLLTHFSKSDRENTSKLYNMNCCLHRNSKYSDIYRTALNGKFQPARERISTDNIDGDSSGEDY